MPFQSDAQRRLMWAQHPDIARRWTAEARRNHTPVVADMDLAEYRRKLAAAYHEMMKGPAAQTFGDPPAANIDLDAAAKAYQSGQLSYEQLHAAQVAADQANAAPIVAAPTPAGPTALPDTSDQAWMQNYAPQPLAGTPATGITPAEEKADVAKGRAQEKADEAKAKEKPAVDKSKLALASTGAGEKEGGSGGSRSPLDVSLVPRAQSATIAAHETPTVDPGRIAQLDKDQQDIIGANQAIGQAQDQVVRAGADAQAQRAQLLDDQQADMLRHAQERDAYLQRQEEHIAKLSDEVAKAKIDPFKEESPLDRARYAIAAALGGFVSGFRGTPNYALQEINQQIDRKIQLQKEAIERKKGQLGDMQGVLASAYRRFGNMDQAEAAARAMGLQQFDAEQQAYAAKLGDPVAVAKSQMLSKQMQFDKDKLLGSLYQYTPARTVSAGGVSAAQQKQVGELAAKFQSEAAANGHEMAPEEARRRAAATLGITASAGTPYADMAKQAKGDASKKALENVNVPEAPRSVEWHPERNVQGTDAQKNLIDQQQYNFAVAATLKKAMGERVSPEMLMDVGKGFVINPGDSQETIQRKNEGLKSYVASVQAGANPSAPPAEKLPEGEPESGD